jgi:mono/diheme cytochrome c family protein
MYILRVLFFIGSILGGFAYIAQQIPQEVSMPPQEEKFDAAKVQTVEDVIEIGQKIFFGKGQCALCHALGGGTHGRCPNLGGDNPVGVKLNREFEYETYTNPEAYIYMDYTQSPPKQFAARMPQINKQPIGLSEPEMLTVFAFLQSRTGTVEITPEEIIAMAQKHSGEGAPVAEVEEVTGNTEEGAAVFASMECSACHQIKGETTVSEGAKKSVDLDALVKDKTIAAVRTAIFTKSEYHIAYDEKMTVKQMRDLIAYLFSFKKV